MSAPDLSAGTVCLQGGREFFPDCLPMDAAVLAAAGDGPVVVLPSAARPGRDYAGAGANGARHYRDAGATDVQVAPDPRDGEAATVRALTGARVVVLPGGSPTSLHAALVGTAVGEAVRAVLAAGGAVMGASAGAMVLCGSTALPDAPGGLRVVPGLEVVPGALVLAHWSGPRPEWVGPAPAGTLVLGLAEASGLLLRPPPPGAPGLEVTAVGVGVCGVERAGVVDTLAPGDSRTL